jgi:hypothetical protein
MQLSAKGKHVRSDRVPCRRGCGIGGGARLRGKEWVCTSVRVALVDSRTGRVKGKGAQWNGQPQRSRRAAIGVPEGLRIGPWQALVFNITGSCYAVFGFATGSTERLYITASCYAVSVFAPRQQCQKPTTVPKTDMA